MVACVPACQPLPVRPLQHLRGCRRDLSLTSCSSVFYPVPPHPQWPRGILSWFIYTLTMRALLGLVWFVLQMTPHPLPWHSISLAGGGHFSVVTGGCFTSNDTEISSPALCLAWSRAETVGCLCMNWSTVLAQDQQRFLILPSFREVKNFLLCTGAAKKAS